MAEEIRLFLRSAVYAAVVAVVYWFLSYDPVGTVLLGGFSLASWVAVGLLRRGQPHAARLPSDGRPGDAVDRPFLDESGRTPSPSGAPVLVGLGIGIAGMGAVFGLWFVIAGAIPFVLGALDWLQDMTREYEATERHAP